MKSDPSSRDVPIQSVALKNGLTLDIYDHSRILTGDRWRVAITAKIEIPVGCIETPQAEAVQAALGNHLVFEQSRKRHFVDADLKDAVLQELIDSLLSSLRVYISHPEFAQRFAIREYQRRLTQLALHKQFSDRDEG
jgi:hypothetical protein